MEQPKLKLSIDSVRFLQEAKRTDAEKRKGVSWKKKYTRLFLELFDIVNNVGKAVNEVTMAKWKVIYEGNPLDEQLSYNFKIHLEEGGDTHVLQLDINPFGTSSLAMPLCTSARSDEPLQSFFESPAYKRYFADHSDSIDHLRTVISSKQITSRYFGEYLIHIVNMMRPYLSAICVKDKHALIAA